MNNDVDPRLTIKMRAELLKYAVMREIFCPVTGAVLDMRRAVLVDDTNAGGSMVVMTADTYDKIAETLATKVDERGIEIYDGRVLFTSTGRVRYPKGS